MIRFHPRLGDFFLVVGNLLRDIFTLPYCILISQQAAQIRQHAKI